MRFRQRTSSRLGEIKAACRLAQRDAGADAYAPGAVECASGTPAGLSGEDVWLALKSVEPGALDGEHPIAPHGRHAAMNRTCRQVDLAAGFDAQVTPNDADGIARLLRWQPGK